MGLCLLWTMYAMCVLWALFAGKAEGEGGVCGGGLTVLGQTFSTGVSRAWHWRVPKGAWVCAVPLLACAMRDSLMRGTVMLG